MMRRLEALRHARSALVMSGLLLGLGACADGLVPTEPRDVELTTDRTVYGPRDTVFATLRNRGGATVGVSPYIWARRRQEGAWAETAQIVGPDGGVIVWEITFPLQAKGAWLDTIPVAWLSPVPGSEFRLEYVVNFSQSIRQAVESKPFVVEW
jgi:predicted dehydrogenase